MSDQTRHTVDPRFTYREKRSGKDVVLYVGLLDAAHRAGLVDVTPVVLQFPTAENERTCIVMATARFADGRAFSALGDANPKNVGPTIAPHYIRMAETRAKARALRDALNIGMVTAEELGGADEEAPQTRQDAPGAPEPGAAYSWAELKRDLRAHGISGRQELDVYLGEITTDWKPADILTAVKDRARETGGTR